MCFHTQKLLSSSRPGKLLLWICRIANVLLKSSHIIYIYIYMCVCVCIIIIIIYIYIYICVCHISYMYILYMSDCRDILEDQKDLTLVRSWLMLVLPWHAACHGFGPSKSQVEVTAHICCRIRTRRSRAWSS